MHGSLDTRLELGQTLGWQNRIAIAMQAAAGLAFLHRVRLVLSIQRGNRRCNARPLSSIGTSSSNGMFQDLSIHFNQCFRKLSENLEPPPLSTQSLHPRAPPFHWPTWMPRAQMYC